MLHLAPRQDGGGGGGGGGGGPSKPESDSTVSGSVVAVDDDRAQAAPAAKQRFPAKVAKAKTPPRKRCHQPGCHKSAKGLKGFCAAHADILDFPLAPDPGLQNRANAVQRPGVGPSLAVGLARSQYEPGKIYPFGTVAAAAAAAAVAAPSIQGGTPTECIADSAQPRPAAASLQATPAAAAAFTSKTTAPSEE